MALSDSDKKRLRQTEAELKNQTVFFPVVATILFTLVGLSVYFYHTVENWSWLDSLYFVVVTMATVGYGDFTPTTSISRMYTITLILIGIATFTTFITQLAKRQGLKRVRKELKSHKD